MTRSEGVHAKVKEDQIGVEDIKHLVKYVPYELADSIDDFFSLYFMI